MIRWTYLSAKHFISVLVVILVAGCFGDSFEAESESLSLSSVTPGPEQVSDVSEADRVRAYRRASLIFLKQAPNQQKLEDVRSQAAYEQAIDEIIDSESFLQTLRSYHQEFFKMQGSRGDINMNEPANLAAYLIKENLNFREILRATYCVDNDLNTTSCSSFSGSQELAERYGAGVVTTQAFLSRWEGAFSFLRASEMLKAFACHDYPDEEDVGMKVAEVSEQAHTFACTTECVPQCYSCHRTMNARSALFYKFDVSGVFNTNPSQAMAIKRDDGSVSNLRDLLNEGAKPRFRQKEVENLRDYAVELSRTAKFRKCLAKRLALFSLGATTHEVDLPHLLKDVDRLMIRHSFRVKDFYRELLRSEAYVLQ